MTTMQLKCECGTCRTCKDRARHRRWYYAKPENREKANAYSRNYQREHRGMVNAHAAKYAAANPEKRLAKRLVREAIARGDLVRLACEVCGEPKSEAHHDDYRKPLVVRFLCRAHHKEHHRVHGPEA